MIIIRKQQTGEVFDIPPDFRMQIDNTSPVFNALGSLVVSASIPNDRPGTNRRLLGFPNRAESSERPPSKMPVIVSYGSFVRNGSLTVNSAINSKGTFSCSIAFDEGEMYERMKDVRLKDLTTLPVIEKSVSEIMTMLNDLAHYDDPQSDLSVFPLCLDNFENHEIVEGTGGYNREILFLNNYEKSDDGTTYNLTDINHYYNSSAERIEVNLPGFGVSPFVRVWKILELIVGHLGYTMGSNPYKEHFQLRKLVAVNNVADAIVSGRIDYRVLMPDTTMGDFLSSLFARHGARLFFNSNTRVVDIILLKDILQSREYTQLDKYQSSPYDLVFTKAKQLMITGQRSLYRASTSADTWEDFYRKYNGQIGVANFVADHRDGGVWYSTTEGAFFQTASTGNAIPRFISSIHFDWDKKVEDMAYEKISGNDESMIQTFYRYIGSVDLVSPVFSTGPAFFYTGLLVKQAQVDEQTVTCPLAFAFSMGNASTSINFGSIFPYDLRDHSQYYIDEEGNEYNYALTFSGKDGSFQRFFRDYDAFFRYSNHEHTCDYKLPVTFLSNMNMQVKAMLANQPLLLDRIPHQLGAKETVTVVSRTTRLYEPYDLEADYFEPVSEGILYKWVQTNNMSDKVLAAQLAKIDELKARENDPHVDPPYRFISLLPDKTEDITKPSEVLWLLPPTKSDHDSGRTASRGTYKVNAFFKHTYEELVNGNWALFSDKPLELIVTYDSWWKPALVSE